MDKLPKPPSLKQLKARAKKISRICGTKHRVELERLAAQYGFGSYHGYRQKTAVTTTSKEPKYALLSESSEALTLVFSMKIAGIVWSLGMERSMPWLFAQLPAQDKLKRVCPLGLCQRLLPPGQIRNWRHSYRTSWAVTKYGTDVMLDLPRFNDVEARTLSKNFGIPIDRPKFWREAAFQSTEIFFYQSPAFTVLRQAIRQGRAGANSLRGFSAYLSTVGAVLIAMSDDDFLRYGDAVAELRRLDSLQPMARKWRYWFDLLSLVESHWPEASRGSPAVEELIARLVPKLLQKGRAVSQRFIDQLPTPLPRDNSEWGRLIGRLTS